MSATIAVHCHSCDGLLGMFAPADDHSSVVMLCPKCSVPCEIDNSAMLEVLENPDDYEPNDRITASACSLDDDEDEDFDDEDDFDDGEGEE